MENTVKQTEHLVFQTTMNEKKTITMSDKSFATFHENLLAASIFDYFLSGSFFFVYIQRVTNK